MSIPGFIDLQVNGYLGVDYSDLSLTEEKFTESCVALEQNGTVGFLPTIVTSSSEVYKQNLKVMVNAINRNTTVENMVLGFHLEGPFLSPKDGARGAHPREHIRKPDMDFFKQLIDWSEGHLKLITIAAEISGASHLCKYANKNGITVSLGHQLASYHDLIKLRKCGAKGLTHLGNANPHMVDRHKNALIAGLAAHNLEAMMITDGHHIPDELIQLILLTRGCEHSIVVSDASPFAGMQPGSYSTIGLTIQLEKSGKLFNPETGYLVGSSFTMLECMNYLAGLNLCNEAELEQLGFYNPLQFIGVNDNQIPSQARIEFKNSAFTLKDG